MKDFKLEVESGEEKDYVLVVALIRFLLSKEESTWKYWRWRSKRDVGAGLGGCCSGPPQR